MILFLFYLHALPNMSLKKETEFMDVPTVDAVTPGSLLHKVEVSSQALDGGGGPLTPIQLL